jgi:hypothetical protein
VCSVMVLLGMLLPSAQDTNASLDQGAAVGLAAEACRSADSTPTSDAGGGALSSAALAGERSGRARVCAHNCNTCMPVVVLMRAASHSNQPAAVLSVPVRALQAFLGQRQRSCVTRGRDAEGAASDPPSPVPMLCAQA